jgi:hypothetical protein
MRRRSGPLFEWSLLISQQIMPTDYVVDMSFPAGQSNLNLHTSGDCNNGTKRKREKKTLTRI